MTNEPKTIRDDFQPKLVLDVENGYAMAQMRNEFIALAASMCEIIYEGKERNMAYVRLQEACMWAVKAISMKGIIPKNNCTNTTYE